MFYNKRRHDLSISDDKKITEHIGTDFYSRNYQSFFQVIGSSGNKKKSQPNDYYFAAKNSFGMINIDHPDIYGAPCDCGACGGGGCSRCS